MSDSPRYMERRDLFSPSNDALGRLRWHAKGVPEVRWRRVLELRKTIAEGRFIISPARIAEAMLGESLHFQ